MLINSTSSLEEQYLDLLKKCLTRYIFGETWHPILSDRGSAKAALFLPAQKALELFGLRIVRHYVFDPEMRANGLDCPAEAETMIGLRQLENIQFCVLDVLRQGTPGDLLEAGVWRGGAAIFMRGILKAYRNSERAVWVADSFEGLPRPEDRYPVDRGNIHWRSKTLSVGLKEVKRNFERYGLLDDRVRFLKGWFRDTLPAAPIRQLAVLRIDADMFGSTMDALGSLYPKLSKGGYAIMDDYKTIPKCRSSIDEYRAQHGIRDEIRDIDGSAVFWQKRT